MIEIIKRINNREVSWLSFNHRVLQEAADPQTPLIERMRFLGIFSNNLDEFFKVRVASVRRMVDFKINPMKDSGIKPKELLKELSTIVIWLQQEFGVIYHNILHELKKENIYIINEYQINNEQAVFVKQYFKEKVNPILSVILLRKDLDLFPYFKDRTIYLATKLVKTHKNDSKDYAFIEIPSSISRFVELPSTNGKRYIVLLDDVIRFCLPDVFAMFKYDSFEAYTMKITRDAELDIDNDLSRSFLEKISKSVTQRAWGQPVRFLYDSQMPLDLYEYITTKLNFSKEDNIIPGGRYHNFKDFMKFPSLGREDLIYKDLKPLYHHRLINEKKILNIIAQKDLVLHFPYHSFISYINLLKEASIDPDVKEIKSTIYRAASDSIVVKALKNAARNGKKVTVNVELQARFDEAANIQFARELQDVGVKVLFGIQGLKVHSKLTVITRKEKDGIVDYACVGTGNFHEGTAKVYTDFLLMTADKRIAEEVNKVFDFFENTYKNFTFNNLIVSPLNQRRRLINLIDDEMKNASAGRNAYIILKVNNLVDKEMINKLYDANNAGVKIKLIVRGVNCLIPGIQGMSENIEGVSIVDRFLEHSRIFVFCNNCDPLYYISSADWMSRNIDNRVEVTCPIYDEDIKKEIQYTLDMHLSDNLKSRIINEKQDNIYRKTNSKHKVRAQTAIYDYYVKRDLL